MNLATQSPSQLARYEEAVSAHGADIARFAAGYEHDSSKRQELLQEVHLALWQSLAGYRGQCALRTWIYRVAHNVCVTHIQHSKRAADRAGIDLEALTATVDESADISLLDRELDLNAVMAVVHSLKPLDRQVMLLYLEDLEAAAIAEVTGLASGNVATKVHRIKTLLAERLDAKRKSS
jgi:RNA polymerase sigma-70 factor (ECF subfamily)